MDPTRAVARTEHLVLVAARAPVPGRRARAAALERAVALRVPGVHPPRLGARRAPRHDASLPEHGCDATRVRPSLPPGESRVPPVRARAAPGRGTVPPRGRSEDRSAVGWRTGGWNDQGRNTGMMLEVLWAKGEVTIAGREASAALGPRGAAAAVDGTRLSPGEEARRLLDVQLRALGIARTNRFGWTFEGARPPAGSGRSDRSSGTAARSPSASTARAGRGGPTRRSSIARSGRGRSCCRRSTGWPTTARGRRSCSGSASVESTSRRRSASTATS